MKWIANPIKSLKPFLQKMAERLIGIKQAISVIFIDEAIQITLIGDNRVEVEKAALSIIGQEILKAKPDVEIMVYGENESVETDPGHPWFDGIHSGQLDH